MPCVSAPSTPSPAGANAVDTTPPGGGALPDMASSVIASYVSPLGGSAEESSAAHPSVSLVDLPDSASSMNALSPEARMALLRRPWRGPVGTYPAVWLDEFGRGHGEGGFEDEAAHLAFIHQLPSPLANLPDHLKLPPLSEDETRRGKITVVLDLDETLVHCRMQPWETSHDGYDPDLNPSITNFYDVNRNEPPLEEMEFEIVVNGQPLRVYARLRPKLREFLQAMADEPEIFDVVVFTASQAVYADALLDRIDPAGNLVSHRRYRDTCVQVGPLFVKDLRALGRPLDRVVLVDNALLSFGYNMDSGVPIRSWYGRDRSDRALHELTELMFETAEFCGTRRRDGSLFRAAEALAALGTTGASASSPSSGSSAASLSPCSVLTPPLTKQLSFNGTAAGTSPADAAAAAAAPASSSQDSTDSESADDDSDTGGAPSAAALTRDRSSSSVHSQSAAADSSQQPPSPSAGTEGADAAAAATSSPKAQPLRDIRELLIERFAMPMRLNRHIPPPPITESGWSLGW
ncbi:hypothetical protein H696_04025 [Fonticula alba]|uniref:Mitochondrial import inner membrane translocase subunit TIM50 n=1 Tax=Fonticula alba TaxID=691883 RepID=A0A058Z663_FONAL|nr:hypothetical protein H696_04025 [Fonticula alba]KCV69606.1 hypothetical protein H696_04025 [Fonticula alba]|eukprot:XP_009496171.1 hypothetical protein H696_04025 [Fonticula alba]